MSVTVISLASVAALPGLYDDPGDAQGSRDSPRTGVGVRPQDLMRCVS